MKKIRVVELFAGVGGFRIGLDLVKNPKAKFETIWSSQWEPGVKTQHASEIYRNVFGNDGHSNEDIQFVVENKFNEIPDHDLLVGGFPCQDYSVAKANSYSQGITGKKGILWWSIYNILFKKGVNAPKYILLENVDRLLKSPSKQRGKDFAVMLSSLNDLGYIVEWRVINAADYGFPQRRRRTFIFAYKKNTNHFKKLLDEDKSNWIIDKSLFNNFFKVKIKTNFSNFKIEGDLAFISENFSKNNSKKSPFEDCGICIDRNVTTVKTTPEFNGDRTLLKHIIEDEDEEKHKEYYINEDNFDKWKYLKGAKREKRVTGSGFEYDYTEGSMVFPDDLDKPSRTIITGEGGKSPSRFKHVIKTKSGKHRRLTPIELERLNMFPDNHTQFMLNGVKTPDIKRAFIMGNALVVGIITKLGEALALDF